MRVLVIGGGGREHALAWTLARSPQVETIYVAPGNGGTESGADSGATPVVNVPIPDADTAGLLDFAHRKAIGLTVVGPEAPLAAGLVDEFQARGLRCFGPSQVAAELEGSKAFAKAFMARHGLPTARFGIFDDFDEGLAWMRSVDYPVVVKASGLAAGKGVIVPEDLAGAEAALRHLLIDRAFGEAGATVVIEERLTGPEASLLAFTDGETVVPMPVAQDHKRLLDGDRGPNTGGMGAYAPADVLCATDVQRLTETVLVPTVAGLRASGRRYVGVLYAGFILTADGPRLLEFNCRLGDPEAQVVLPLLASDLVDVCNACIDHRLGEIEIRWHDYAAACVVAAAEGYPVAYEKGRVITGVDDAAHRDGVTVFHAGTRRRDDGALVTHGGRVLAVTALRPDIQQAVDAAHAGLAQIEFEGKQHRRDIGRGISDAPDRYREAGVDLDTGARIVDQIRDAVTDTHGPEVLAGVGAFGGLYDAGLLREMRRPVLVASTDGVGTKTIIASALDRFDTLGEDLVNHCINDILVQGARPLFFLDYVAASHLQAGQISTVIHGIARACKAAGCALLGGETAEMPDVYAPHQLDVVGTVVGVVDRDAIIDGRRIAKGDAVIGLASSGLHTNGYSLARHVLRDVPLGSERPELGQTIGDALLAPHRCYLGPVQGLRSQGIDVRGLVHITGGGLIENPPRILPVGLAMELDHDRWPVPPIFPLLARLGDVSPEEMARVFNLGLGMLVVVPSDQVDAALDALDPQTAWAVGRVTSRGHGPAVRRR